MDQEMENAEEDIITLTNEEGEEFNFQVVDVIEVEGTEYALLLPVDGESEDDEEEVLVLRFVGDQFEMIEDQAEFDRVVKYLEENTEEE